MKLNISDYEANAAGGDWSLALLSAITDLGANGGEIVFDEGLTTHKTGISETTVNNPITISGDGASRLSLQGTSPTSNVVFSFGNKPRVLFEKLIMEGHGSDVTKDCNVAINAGYVLDLVIQHCLFAGIHAHSAVLNLTPAAHATVRDSQFSGGAGKQIYFNGGKSLHLDNVKMLDYIVLGEVYHSKTPIGAAWVICENPASDAGQRGANRSVIEINRCMFDEGSQYGVYVKDYPLVQINQTRVNVNSSSDAAGFYMENVESVIIKQTNCGYTEFDRPFGIFKNCGKVVIIGCQQDGGVSRVINDGSQKVTIVDSPNLVLEDA